MLCSRCFQATEHEGHEIVFTLSAKGGGCCDCGDREAWKVDLKCKIHSGDGTSTGGGGGGGGASSTGDHASHNNPAAKIPLSEVKKITVVSFQFSTLTTSLLFYFLFYRIPF